MGGNDKLIVWRCFEKCFSHLKIEPKWLRKAVMSLFLLRPPPHSLLWSSNENLIRSNFSGLHHRMSLNLLTNNEATRSRSAARRAACFQKTLLIILDQSVLVYRSLDVNLVWTARRPALFVCLKELIFTPCAISQSHNCSHTSHLSTLISASHSPFSCCFRDLSTPVCAKSLDHVFAMTNLESGD